VGTAGSSKGSASATPLVPSWLDNDSAQGDAASSQETTDQAAIPSEPTPATEPVVKPKVPLPIIEAPPSLGRFQGARGNFTSFARSGGNDSRALRRAVRDYVRSGTRGSANAVRRMGSSRAAGGVVLRTLRDFQRSGVAETLRYLNLSSLVGQSVENVLLGLTEIICNVDGGSLDEALVRDAWIETVAEIDSLEIPNLDTLNDAQIDEIFIAFIANTVETRLLQEIGVSGFKVAADNSTIAAFEAQLSSYIRLGVRDALRGSLVGLANMTDTKIKSVVDDTYRDAWNLFVAWGDQS
jgi:hypothetical protein